MKTLMPGGRTWVAGLAAATAASLCCVTPAVAFLSGISSVAASVSWMIFFHPFFICITMILIEFAWYRQLSKDKTNDGCECVVKPASFFQSSKFLFIITSISALLICFSYYSSVFYSAPKTFSYKMSGQQVFRQVQLSVTGMDCAACTNHIDSALPQIPGVFKIKTSFEKGVTTVSYDPAKTSVDSLKNKIKQVGYHVTPAN